MFVALPGFYNESSSFYVVFLLHHIEWIALSFSDRYESRSFAGVWDTCGHTSVLFFDVQ